MRCGKGSKPCEKRDNKDGCVRCIKLKVRCTLLDGQAWDGEVDESPRKKRTRSDDGLAQQVAERVSEELVEEVLELVMEKMDEVLEENRRLREVVEGFGDHVGEMALVMRSWWAREARRDRELEFGKEKEKEKEEDEEDEVAEETSGEGAGEKAVEELVAMAVDGDEESSTLRD